jgi:hypothetical protein
VDASTIQTLVATTPVAKLFEMPECRRFSVAKAT